MTKVPDLLDMARSNLLVTRDDLNQALRLAKARRYNPRWADAIRKTQSLNEEAIRHLSNVITNVRPPEKLTPLSLGNDPWTHSA